MVVCLERGANDLHIVQLMPLPPCHLLLHQNSEWFILLVPAYPGCPGKRPLNGCVCVYCVVILFTGLLLYSSLVKDGITEDLTFSAIVSIMSAYIANHSV